MNHVAIPEFVNAGISCEAVSIHTLSRAELD